MIMDEKKDKGLQGNEKIEEAILALQQEPTEELLAHADGGAQTDAGAGAVHRGGGTAFRRCERSGDAGCRNRYALTGGADL